MSARDLTRVPSLSWRVFAAGLMLWTVGSGLSAAPLLAQTPPVAPAQQVVSELPAGFEPYSARPDVLTLTPQSASLGPDWERLRRGHLEATAQLLEMYPDHELYFLARDSELLYDFARIVTEKEPPAARSRIHLLNVSRANMRAEHIREYLAQEGISEQALRAGKRVLFVDTGFSGTIPRVISELFPSELRPRLRTHLMSSSNPAHPSSRVFLTAINPAAPRMNPGQLHGSIVAYEHIPRFTDRSTRFERPQGRWEPISPVGSAKDGSVSREKAVAYQRDLLAYARTPENRELLERKRAFWKRLRALAAPGGPPREQQITELKALLASAPEAESAYTEAALRDYLELRATHLPPAAGAATIQAADLGLPELMHAGKSTGKISNKNQLIQKYPEWAPVLEDPQTQIPKLMDAQEWGKLGAITDTVIDHEFMKILAQSLGVQAPTAGHRGFVKQLIEKNAPATWSLLATYTFSEPHTAPMSDLIRLLIEKNVAHTWRLLAQYTFSQPHTAPMSDLIRLLIEKNDPETWSWLATYTFSLPHTAPMSDLIRLLIEKSDPHLDPHLLRLISEKLPASHFPKPMYSALTAALQIQDPTARKAFLDQKLGPPASPAPEFTKLEAGASPTPGSSIQTPQGRSLRVESFIDEGKRGRVYRVRDPATGQAYALKLARDARTETLASLAQETTKAQAYAKLGLPHAGIVESGKGYAIKQWIEGVRADAWLKEWEKAGFPANAPELEALRTLIHRSANQGAYVGDLNAKNLIWDGKAWVVIDSGSIREGLSVKEALARYQSKLPERWAKRVSAASTAQACLISALQQIVD